MKLPTYIPGTPLKAKKSVKLLRAEGEKGIENSL